MSDLYSVKNNLTRVQSEIEDALQASSTMVAHARTIEAISAGEDKVKAATDHVKESEESLKRARKDLEQVKRSNQGLSAEISASLQTTIAMAEALVETARTNLEAAKNAAKEAEAELLSNQGVWQPAFEIHSTLTRISKAVDKEIEAISTQIQRREAEDRDRERARERCSTCNDQGGYCRDCDPCR